MCVEKDDRKHLHGVVSLRLFDSDGGSGLDRHDLDRTSKQLLPDPVWVTSKLIVCLHVESHSVIAMANYTTRPPQLKYLVLCILLLV